MHGCNEPYERLVVTCRRPEEAGVVVDAQLSATEQDFECDCKSGQLRRKTVAIMEDVGLTLMPSMRVI